MNFFINLIVNALAVIIASYALPGVTVTGLLPAILAAVVLALANAFIRPILTILTLPINVLTLGLFSFVISAIIILLVAAIVPGFGVASFWSALLFSLVLALVVYVLNMLLPGTPAGF
jgi:putative membrane protein